VSDIPQKSNGKYARERKKKRGYAACMHDDDRTGHNTRIDEQRNACSECIGLDATNSRYARYEVSNEEE